MTAPIRHGRFRTTAGFTLLEMVAVLAILAILASALAPNIASQLRRARSDAEDASLAELGRLLSESVQRGRTIPGPGSWADSVARLSDLPRTRIDSNEDNFRRLYLPDPAWSPASSRPSASAGWTQTPSLAWGMSGSFPANCRILVVSGSRRDPAAACGGLDATQFDRIWNRTGGPAACAEGNDVRLGRVNLTALFHLVTLSADVPGSFTFDGDLARRQVFAAGSASFPVLEGTRLTLLNAAGTSSMTEIVVNRAVSASFDGASWTAH